jgi:hypothetical protein
LRRDGDGTDASGGREEALGPFAETKEQIGGYFVIEAKDLNEAIHVASRIPGARLGCVEVRPIADDPQTRALRLDTLETSRIVKEISSNHGTRGGCRRGSNISRGVTRMARFD